jgi:hypothetical protein
MCSFLKNVVVFVALSMSLALALASDPLSGVQWRSQKVEDWQPPLRGGSAQNAGGAKVAEPQHASNGEQYGAIKAPLLLNDYPQSPSPQSGAHQTNEEIQRQQLEIQWWVMAFTGVLAFNGLLQVALFVLQVGYGIRAANAAKGSADVATRTLKITQRGRLAIKDWKFDRSLSDTKDTIIDRVECSLVNVGATPVRLIGHYVGMWDNPRAVDYRYRQFKRGDFTGMPVLAQDRHPLWIDLPKEISERNVSRGTQELYIFVYVVYDDGFGDQRETARLVGYDTRTREFVAFPDPHLNYGT